ncbi:hypothetical protein V5799_025581 [Amblyomma americanum]|uniref:Secreted protein n=1 Tax=Amblyomma americanum TaxID=6943 RepID=A0AAQ4E913_AMBAM
MGFAHIHRLFTAQVLTLALACFSFSKDLSGSDIQYLHRTSSLDPPPTSRDPSPAETVAAPVHSCPVLFTTEHPICAPDGPLGSQVVRSPTTSAHVDKKSGALLLVFSGIGKAAATGFAHVHRLFAAQVITLALVCFSSSNALSASDIPYLYRTSSLDPPPTSRDPSPAERVAAPVHSCPVLCTTEHSICAPDEPLGSQAVRSPQHQPM